MFRSGALSFRRLLFVAGLKFFCDNCDGADLDLVVEDFRRCAAHQVQQRHRPRDVGCCRDVQEARLLQAELSGCPPRTADQR